MKLFDLINLKDKNLIPNECKIHLATSNGKEDPLDVFFSGEFEDWQSFQAKKNYERKYIVSLIKMGGENRWLFAGIYQSFGCDSYNEKGKYYKYKTEYVACFDEFVGRLILIFDRAGKQSYRDAENKADDILVSELLPEPLTIEMFPGFSNVIISKAKLDLIISKNIESWKGALSSVAGVYLITDTLTGKLYVGSAVGEQGIWQRWSAYSANGHGDNTELRKLIRAEGEGCSNNFQYSILEIADTHASEKDVLVREGHWKNVLCSRTHGNNRN